MNGQDRVSKWDNIKTVLIFLVVLGHCAGHYAGKSANIRWLYLFMFMFHMPLFLFLSGMFSRKMIETGEALRRRVVGYVILGFLLKFALAAVKIGFGKQQTLSMWSEQGVPWYLFCLAAYLVLTRFLRKVPRGFLIGLAVITACFAGYDRSVAGTFALSRFFVFYPFFLMGTCWDPAWTEPRKGKWIWKGAAALIVVGTGWFVYRNLDLCYPLVNFVKGWRPYSIFEKAYGAGFVRMGGFARLAYYAGSILLAGAVAVVIPSGKNIFTGIGRRTLQIYLYHRPILYIMLYTHVDRIVKQIYPPHWKMAYLGLSLVLTCILAAPVLELPLKWFWKQLEDL